MKNYTVIDTIISQADGVQSHKTSVDEISTLTPTHISPTYGPHQAGTVHYCVHVHKEAQN